jgi:tetratricopeptide (TPR) repeat protein
MSPPTLPRTSKNNEIYTLNYLSKKLNNRAAYQITTKGNYEEGIIILTKALRLNEQSMVERKDEIFCTCKCCCFDSYLVLEEEKKCLTTIMMDVDNNIDSDFDFDNNKEERHSRNSSVDFSSEDSMDCNNVTDNNNDTPFTHHRQQHMKKTHDSSSSSQRVEENDDGFIYRRLLLVNNRCIEEDHFMGLSLSLIIIFNLALAHHLIGIDNNTNINDSSASSTTTIGYCSTNNKKLNALQHALKLYELAYQLHIDYIEQLSQIITWTTTDDDDDDDDINNHTKRSIVSLRLTMIVSNNLGQIHRVAGNTKKHIMCLQHLLNSIMYMGQQRQLVHVLDSNEFDGFFLNLSPIVFNDVCASAA